MPNRRRVLDGRVDDPQFLSLVLASNWKVGIEQLRRIVEEGLVQITHHQRMIDFGMAPNRAGPISNRSRR